MSCAPQMPSVSPSIAPAVEVKPGQIWELRQGDGTMHRFRIVSICDYGDRQVNGRWCGTNKPVVRITRGMLLRGERAARLCEDCFAPYVPPAPSRIDEEERALAARTHKLLTQLTLPRSMTRGELLRGIGRCAVRGMSARATSDELGVNVDVVCALWHDATKAAKIRQALDAARTR